MTKDKLYELFGFFSHPEVPSDGSENSHTLPAVDTGEGYSFYKVTFKEDVENPFKAIAAASDGEPMIQAIEDGVYYVAIKGACYAGEKLV